MGHFIELAGWKRREHFRYYRRFANPFFSVSVELDATSLWRRCRQAEGRSFFLASMFALIRAVNGTEAFRLRIRGEEVWLHDRIGIGTTILRPDETFALARFDPAVDFVQFQEAGLVEVARARQTSEPLATDDRDDLVFHSTLPWIRFSSFSNALPLGDSVPRVVFGKCSADGEQHRLPVAIEVHHALVDGLDVARLLERLEHEMATLSA